MPPAKRRVRGVPGRAGRGTRWAPGKAKQWFSAIHCSANLRCLENIWKHVMQKHRGKQGLSFRMSLVSVWGMSCFDKWDAKNCGSKTPPAKVHWSVGTTSASIYGRGALLLDFSDRLEEISHVGSHFGRALVITVAMSVCVTVRIAAQDGPWRCQS